jgi:hypothetical protein
MQAWSELERVVTSAAMLREHLYRAIGYGDEAEIRRLRSELAFIAKQRRDALTNLNDQIALYA